VGNSLAGKVQGSVLALRSLRRRFGVVLSASRRSADLLYIGAASVREGRDNRDRARGTRSARRSDRLADWAAAQCSNIE